MAKIFFYHNRRRRRGNSNPAQVWLFSGGLLTMALVLSWAAFIGALVGAYSYFTKDLAHPETIATREVARSTKIYDRKGQLLYEIFDPQVGRRTLVPLSEISPYLIQATIATEDADFYRNTGINVRGIVRAAWQNVTSRDVVGGGSSITQQLVKNVLIPEEERTQVSITRKIKEAILALEITRRYPKDLILQWYLNEIYYGNLSYGAEAAAQSYFGKSAKNLGLAEAAMLAGLPQAPARYSPLTDYTAAKKRQETVLDLMVRQSYITRGEAEAAKAEELRLSPQQFFIKAPHFVMYVRDLLENRYGAKALYKKGLEVTTSLDLETQQAAESAVKEYADRLKKYSANNAALTAIDPRTGEILAMVGSIDYFDSKIQGQVNMTTAERQPGSAFKPFTYVTAFMKGYTPATMLLDIRSSFPDGINPPYVPGNVDKKFRGLVSVRQALAQSMNIPAVRTIAFTGVDNVIETAHRMGITTLTRKNTYGLALTLGGGEVKPLDMAFAFGVFANGGKMIGEPIPSENKGPGMRELNPVAILRVKDGEGNTLEEFTKPQVKQIISPQLAYLITDILSDNQARAPLFGWSSPLRLGGDRPAAVKTGTTEDWRDTWTVGYSPELVAAVWVGNADNKPMLPVLSMATAAPIWHDFMEAALANTPPTPFVKPPGIVEAIVCVPSGLLPTPNCPDTKKEIFLEGTIPKEPDNLYQTVRIDRKTGKLATSQTPPQDVEQKVYMVLPPEAADWALANNISQPPKEYSPDSSALVAITYPLAGSTVKGTVTLTGSAGGDGFAQYGLEYGEGLSPERWVQLGPLQDKSVTNGPLATFDTKSLNGLYTLRLTVINRNKGLQRALVSVSVDNTPPSVKVSYPYHNARLVMDPARLLEEVGIQAEATDNLGISRVEFFVDGQRAGTSSVYPYNIPWRLSPGAHTIYAVAYDRAGNSARSPEVTVQILGSG